MVLFAVYLMGAIVTVPGAFYLTYRALTDEEMEQINYSGAAGEVALAVILAFIAGAFWIPFWILGLRLLGERKF